MSKLAYENFHNWGVEEVSSWLGEIHLSNHIPSFERNQITGAHLVELSDKDLRDQLRVVKPSELMALKGAIATLMHPPPKKGQSRTMSVLPKRDRSGSGGNSKQLQSPLGARTQTLPQMHTNWSTTLPSGVIERSVILAPDLREGSAQQLLDDKCRYSGWIRKQGGGHKSWKRRYLILRAGCLYYFSNETAHSPKGKFVLSGYEVSICRETEIVKKYPFVLKVSPLNPQVRTYFVSFGSKGELERWKRELDEEIHQYNQSITERVVMPLGSPPPGSFGEDEEEEQDGGSPHRIYDKVEDDPESPYEKLDTNIYDDPFNGEEGVYDRVEDPSVSGRPEVPTRSRVSLQPTPGSVVLDNTTGEDVDEETDIYLPIIGENSTVLPQVERSVSSPSASTEKPPLDDDYVDPSDEEAEGSDPDSDPDSDGGYYIMFRKPDELMPPSCLFDQLERVDADKLLRQLNVDGTYLIREGRRAGAEKVLSVWHIDRCRHYKLFKDEESFFSLTQGQRFRSLPELLQYYSLQSHLPRSDFYLGNPYCP